MNPQVFKKHLADAHASFGMAIAAITEARKESDSKIICQILLQFEQRWRLDEAHLGTLLGLKSQATVRTNSKATKSRAGAKRPKRQRP